MSLRYSKKRPKAARHGSPWSGRSRAGASRRGGKATPQQGRKRAEESQAEPGSGRGNGAPAAKSSAGRRKTEPG